MTFLPKNYELPKSGSSYMKFEQGENLFRVLSSPIIGWLDWKEEDGKRKPLRFRMDEKPAKPFNPKKPIKHFWAMKVWNYKTEKVEVLEITQSGIQSKIKALVDDSDWGKPFDYDLRIVREGEGLDTEYSLNPKPKKDLPKEIQEKADEVEVNLEALFDGEDPFVKKELADISGDITAEDINF